MVKLTLPPISILVVVETSCLPPPTSVVLEEEDMLAFKVSPRSCLILLVSQEFQMIGLTPNLEPSAWSVTSALSASATPRKEPSILTSLSSRRFTSIQTSTVGSNSIDPSQVFTRYGVTFSTLVANGCSTQRTSS